MQASKLALPPARQAGIGATAQSIITDLTQLKNAGDSAQQQALSQRLLDMHFGTFKNVGATPYFAWPAGYFIPEAADWQNYWFLPCPDSNRYSWTSHIGNGMQTADDATGTISSSVSASPLDTNLRGDAFVGCFFNPPAGRAVYHISPTVNATTVIKRDIDLVYGEGYPNYWKTYMATDIFICVYEHNPADGSFELLPQFGRTTLFSAADYTFGGGVPFQKSVSFKQGDLSVNVELEGSGRSYLIATVATAIIDQTVTDAGNKPLTRIPPDYNYSVFAYAAATVPLITVSRSGPLFPA